MEGEDMATYGDAIKEHARLAVQLYRTRLPEIEQQSGLTLLPDGHCIASTAD
ncbi:MAG: hypothetical protein HZA21_04575, partial [Nitrospirae bacterium]|nr:hypothetical protein [Nitrospirota bacterium]